MFSLSSRPSTGSRIFRKRSRNRDANYRRNHVPGVESLEIRLTPTTDVWTGAAGVLWSTAGNWSNGVPTTGELLDFPATGVTSLVSVNDLTSGTSFDSITINGPGYDLIGNRVELTGSAGITATFASGSSTNNINATLDTGNITVAAGGTLHLLGALSGSAGLNVSVGSSAVLELGGGVGTTGGLTLSRGGELKLTGASSNTYTGTTTIDSGTIVLNMTGGLAIPGDLFIGDVGNDTAKVIDEASGQIAASSNVTLEGSNASLNLGAFNETINSLALDGGSLTATGTLTLGAGGLTVSSGLPDVSLGANLGLASAATPFDVPTGVDLMVSGILSGSGGIAKIDTGTLTLSGNNTYIGATTISNGIMSASGSNALADTIAVTIAAGGELDINGSTTMTAPLTLSGTGSMGNGAIISAAGTNTLSGNLTLAGATTFGVDTGSQLTLSGIIGQSANSDTSR